MTIRIYFQYLLLSIVSGCVAFLYAFVLPLHEHGGSKSKHVAEFMFYGWFMILREPCATVGVYVTQ
jgi:hypothetical protein